jgi:hypothetical protein
MSRIDILRGSIMPLITEDSLAQEEINSKYKDQQRGEQYRGHIHTMVIIGIYVIGAILIIMILIRSYHYLVPKCWKWLNPEQTNDIERIIFSGIILSLSGQYFKKYKVID